MPEKKLIELIKFDNAREDGNFSFKWKRWERKMSSTNFKEEDKTNYRIFKEL
jgi:hypothetical protein